MDIYSHYLGYFFESLSCYCNFEVTEDLYLILSKYTAASKRTASSFSIAIDHLILFVYGCITVFFKDNRSKSLRKKLPKLGIEHFLNLKYPYDRNFSSNFINV